MKYFNFIITSKTRKFSLIKLNELFVQIILTNLLITAPIANSTANVTTIDAPVGISKTRDAIIPNRLPMIPNIQPNTKRFRVPFTNNKAATAGIIRNEKTNSTPAILTELVTTNPKVT